MKTIRAIAAAIVAVCICFWGNSLHAQGFATDSNQAENQGAPTSEALAESLRSSIGLWRSEPATNFYDIRNLITAGGAMRDPFFSVIQDNGSGGVSVTTITSDLSTVNYKISCCIFDFEPDGAVGFPDLGSFLQEMKS